MSTVLFQQPEAHGLEAEVRSLSEKLDRVVAAVEALDRRREEVEELITDLLPAVNGSLGIAMRRLDALERSGALGVARTAGRALEEAVAAVDPGDLAALGAQAGTGLRALREITAPEVTTMTARALAALRTARKGRPKSLRQLLWAAREPRVRRGLGALLDILKVLGEGVGPSSPVASTPSPPALTGRPVAPVASRAPRAAGTGPGCSAPTGPTPPSRETRPLGGVTVSLDSEGFLTDRTAWTPSVAEALAREAGIGPLTDEHWKVLEYCRADAGESGPAPGMRRITSQLGVPARDLYRLFPGGPGILAARLSGLGKPKSCV